MPEHLTSVSELKEVGMVLRASREHTIRVLGAFKVMERKEPTGSKEAISRTLETQVEKQYHSGAIKGTQEDPEKSPLFPQTPSLHVSAENKAEFLKRDVT